MSEASLDTSTSKGLREALQRARYVADTTIATAIYLALKLRKPLLVEGEPGCGKTEIAKVLSEILGTELIRLQCYEGLDVSSAVYEWDYLRQLLKIRLEEGRKEPSEIEPDIFSERFLLARPLLKAVLHKGEKPPVLLIDEIDRADEEFEGFLLEYLAEFQVTVPEVGTIKAKEPAVVIITSNRTRDLGDGIRRRCLYLYITYPTPEKEFQILGLKVPGIEERLGRQIVEFMARIRGLEESVKKPGVAETLDWASALLALGRSQLDEPTVEETISCLVKTAEDLERLRGGLLPTVLKDAVKVKAVGGGDEQESS